MRGGVVGTLALAMHYLRSTRSLSSNLWRRRVGFPLGGNDVVIAYDRGSAQAIRAWIPAFAGMTFRLTRMTSVLRDDAGLWNDAVRER